jgi:ATP-dependent RNA helicase RhlE
MSFQELRLAEPIVRAVAAEGYTQPTPIQSQAIPAVLAGRDLLACAQTGTGKTAAFVLPILQRLLLIHNPHQQRTKIARRPPIRSLILAPTRELASQIGDSVRAYARHTGLRHVAIFGGVNQFHQVRALQAGVDILIATPGRLMDLMQQRHVNLQTVEVFVLDEADRMLDMGFIPDVRRIVAHLPARRQTLMFSATMPADIRRLADSILRDPSSVQVSPAATPVESIEQSVYHVSKRDKAELLERLLLNPGMHRTLVFTRTKHGADKVVKGLILAGIRAAAIHGNKSQGQRTRALDGFKSPTPPVLVATDIASRGIDVDSISHVINYDLPDVPETYVHRIGRTARAGASGVAISFCDVEELAQLRDIERVIRRQIEISHNHRDLATAPSREGRRETPKPAPAPQKRRLEPARNQQANRSNRGGLHQLRSNGRNRRRTRQPGHS